jgi:hypothetical protein
MMHPMTPLTRSRPLIALHVRAIRSTLLDSLKFLSITRLQLAREQDGGTIFALNRIALRPL